MTRLLLIPALILGTVAMATEYNYEITPLIGYNIAEGNIDVDDYAVFGGEFQYNGFDSVIKPELSILYSKADYNTYKLPSSSDTDVWRVALNGVYEYDKLGFITPLAKAGLGYEKMSDSYETQTDNEADCAFVDVGVGAKIPFNDMIALKLEAVYMLKYNDARLDNNLAVLAGLNIAFGEKAQKAAPVTEPEPTPEPAPVVVAVPLVVDGDDDKDGVLNSVDKCPTTPPGVEVDVNGCTVDNDTDKDGVLNAQDICPNTPLGEAVNSDGCPAKITLKVNFANNSAEIQPSSFDMLQKYADFLTKYSAYSANIVGYTDSRGSEAYNQKLSQKRANAVKDMLLEKGVPADRLSSEGKGEANPIADNATSEGRAENRRIEAELIKK